MAVLQYAAMVASAGSPGRALAVQRSLSTARKPFRFVKPLESLAPLVTSPLGSLSPANVAAKARALAMAVYFGFDHFVASEFSRPPASLTRPAQWAHGAGLLQDKAFAERAQQLSFYGWLLGSLLAVALEADEAQRMHAKRAELRASRPPPPQPVAADAGAKEVAAFAEAQAAFAATRASEAAAADALRAKVLQLATSATQVGLAAALLKLLPLSPRATGVLGVASSALAVYQLLPALPEAKSKKD